MFWLSYTTWLAILMVRHFKYISINLIVAFWCVITLKNFFLLSNWSFNLPPLDISLPTLSHHWFSISMRSRLLRILNASRAHSSYRRASCRKPGYLSSTSRAGLWLQLPRHLSICPRSPIIVFCGMWGFSKTVSTLLPKWLHVAVLLAFELNHTSL